MSFNVNISYKSSYYTPSGKQIAYEDENIKNVSCQAALDWARLRIETEDYTPSPYPKERDFHLEVREDERLRIAFDTYVPSSVESALLDCARAEAFQGKK